MAAKVLPAVSKFYYMPKPDIFSRGVPARLPEVYKKFYDEWVNGPKTPVHYRPDTEKWKRDPLTGVVTPVQNVPIKIKYPKEVHTGIWGGEGVILGYKQHKRKQRQKSTCWYVPNLLRSAVYSEIFDKRFSLIVTERTLQLVIEHHGFDKYILETSASDLMSLLALKLKKKMLYALFDKTLYPDDPVKQEIIYNKYKHHLENYNREDLEWYALSISEAVSKLQKMEDEFQPKPLKHQFREEMIEELKSIAALEGLEKIAEGKKKESSSTSWLNRINPFAKKT